MVDLEQWSLPQNSVLLNSGQVSSEDAEDLELNLDNTVPERSGGKDIPVQ